MENVKLMLGDNIEKLRELPDNFVDSIVTDPPYGLSFMNKKWDYDVPSVDFWKEVYRVLKPGGHVLSFGGTRTYHRMVVNMEDAGFEIRDQIMWVYGSGFPKSHNIGKGIDKKLGNEREIIPSTRHSGTIDNSLYHSKGITEEIPTNTKGNSEYEGWGTALKPANEPIVLARKPLSEKTIVDNVLRWGTGGINVDGCRIGYEEKMMVFNNEGRFPANFIIDEEASKILDEQSGESKSPKKSKTGTSKFFKGIDENNEKECFGDTGGASRFFYVPKVSKKERNLGTDKNNHPTVKPINLLTYLVRLITPPNGIVMDCYMGSGSTGIAAQLEGFNFIGMEMDEDYFNIAEARINNWEQYKDLIKKK